MKADWAKSVTTAGRMSDYSGLLARLRLRGVHVSVRETIQVAQMVDFLSHGGVRITDAKDAAGWLLPVIARDRDTIDRARPIIEQWWDGSSGPARKPKDDPLARPIGILGNEVYRQIAITVILAVVGLAGLVYAYFALETLEVAPGTGPTAGEQVVETTQTLSFFVIGRALPHLALIAPFLGALWWLLVRKPREAFAGRGNRPGKRTHDYRGRRVMADFFGSEGAMRSLRLMAQPDVVASRRIDVKKTIAATIESGGEPCVLHQDRLRDRRYVLLIEAASGEDHIHILADGLVANARQMDVDIVRYEIRAHLSYLRYVDGGRRETNSEQLDKIAMRNTGARLLYLGSGDNLVDDDGALLNTIDGAKPSGHHNRMFGHFLSPSLLSTTPMRLWGGHEARLSRAGVTIFPMSEDGLQSVARAMSAEDDADPPRQPIAEDLDPPLLAWIRMAQLDLTSNIPPSASQIDRLVLLLEEYFAHNPTLWRAFLAMALFPAINREATLWILRHIGGSDPEVADILQLARLPWFKVAKMPDWLQLAVIKSADATTIATLRTELTGMLQADNILPKLFGRTDKAEIALHQDDWRIRLAEAAPGFASSERAGDQLLVRFLQGKDADALDQPIAPPRPTPKIVNIAAAIGVTLVALWLLWIDAEKVLTSWVLAAQGWLAANVGGFLLAWAATSWISWTALGIVVLCVLDLRRPAGDARKNWLFRRLSVILDDVSLDYDSIDRDTFWSLIVGNLRFLANLFFMFVYTLARQVGLVSAKAGWLDLSHRQRRRMLETLSSTSGYVLEVLSLAWMWLVVLSLEPQALDLSDWLNALGAMSGITAVSVARNRGYRIEVLPGEVPENAMSLTSLSTAFWPYVPLIVFSCFAFASILYWGGSQRPNPVEAWLAISGAAAVTLACLRSGSAPEDWRVVLKNLVGDWMYFAILALPVMAASDALVRPDSPILMTVLFALSWVAIVLVLSGKIWRGFAVVLTVFVAVLGGLWVFLGFPSSIDAVVDLTFAPPEVVVPTAATLLSVLVFVISSTTAQRLSFGASREGSDGG